MTLSRWSTAGDKNVTVTLEHNRFDFFRHAVAGSGEPGQDYTAHDNLVMSNAIDHVFDMHGQNETNPGATGSEFAGGEILIHGNTVLVRWHSAMVIRGRPEHGAWLYDNCLACASEDSCWEQLHFTGNVHVDQSPTSPAPNKYNQGGMAVQWHSSCSGNSQSISGLFAASRSQ